MTKSRKSLVHIGVEVVVVVAVALGLALLTSCYYWSCTVPSTRGTVWNKSVHSQR